jgi:hypothetical protein
MSNCLAFLPVLSANDEPNGLSRDSEARCKFGIRVALSELAYFFYLVLLQLSKAVSLLVDCWRYGLQVVRIDAFRNPAQVIQMEAGRNWSLSRFVRCPVRADIFSVDAIGAVAIWLDLALPKPATVSVDHIAIKGVLANKLVSIGNVTAWTTLRALAFRLTTIKTEGLALPLPLAQPTFCPTTPRLARLASLGVDVAKPLSAFNAQGHVTLVWHSGLLRPGAAAGTVHAVAGLSVLNFSAVARILPL